MHLRGMQLVHYMAAMLAILLNRISIITPYTGRDQAQNVSIGGWAVGLLEDLSSVVLCGCQGSE
jgi:hypothetical protein